MVPPSPTRFMAGAGIEEITPYAGVPLGGHGPGGRIARGTWMPLYARAFYFEDDEGRAVALVSCDLFAIPGALRAEVVRRVNESKKRLEPGALILSATHTHHGPGNFLSVDAYNAVGSPLPHFDSNIFYFLANHISRAVVAAIDDAQTHAKEDHELVLYSGHAPGIQRNRAITAFYQNDSGVVQKVQDESWDAGSRCPDEVVRNCPRYLSTDPTLKVLEIKRAGTRRAVLVFYAVHPTAMNNTSELYSPDFTGVAMKQIEMTEEHPIAGFFNGAEGDVSPDWKDQDREDVLDLGGAFAKAVSKLLETTTTTRDVSVERRRDVKIKVLWNSVKQKTPEWSRVGFTPPEPGAGEPGGAEDGRTVFYNYGFRGEVRKRGARDPKAPLLEQPIRDLVDAFELPRAVTRPALAFLKVKPDSFPNEFPVARVELSPLVTFAAIPVEATTIVGRRIRERIPGNPIVLGLSNEYFGYAVTEKEYALQQYEGASTELGPDEAEGIIKLLMNVHAEKPDLRVDKQTFKPGVWRKQTFGLDLPLLRVPRNTIDDDLQPLYPENLRRLESRVPRFVWTEDMSGDERQADRRVSVY
ncbi:MAG TPA: neutral/alkaline non-lysosomal ceramidase N-terminal domain-containing protein, partial [Pyrinomonadaceae bacterium]|nr:neutral/alkaline non-lysosomal ceramidase N-terminal domain-containing protein [Pyrinomonadaceae bacterium]